jgi:hypothetical protein
VLLWLTIHETVCEKEVVSFPVTEKEALRDFLLCYKTHVYVGEMKDEIVNNSKHIMNCTNQQQSTI